MYALYSVMLTLALVAYAPIFLLHRLRRGGYGRAFRQRFGRLEPGLPAEPRCWVHAVSVGEAATAVPLVDGIRRRWPELSVVVTTVTPTGARIVAEQLGQTATHRYFPLDLPGPVRRAIEAVRPRFFVGMETEIWPSKDFVTERVVVDFTAGWLLITSYWFWTTLSVMESSSLPRMPSYVSMVRTSVPARLASTAPS
jgi:3-deoxy-D-manno-octulosonic-acid transferase